MLHLIKHYFKKQTLIKEEAARASVLISINKSQEKLKTLHEDLRTSNANIRYLNASIATLKATAVYAKGVDARDTRDRRETIRRNIEIQEKQLVEETFNVTHFEKLINEFK